MQNTLIKPLMIVILVVGGLLAYLWTGSVVGAIIGLCLAAGVCVIGLAAWAIIYTANGRREARTPARIRDEELDLRWRTIFGALKGDTLALDSIHAVTFEPPSLNRVTLCGAPRYAGDPGRPIYDLELTRVRSSDPVVVARLLHLAGMYGPRLAKALSSIDVNGRQLAS